MDLFDVRIGRGPKGGMTIQIGEGPSSKKAATRSIYLTDEAYSFVEPVLVRLAPDYHPDTRWGVAEIDASVWRQAVVEFNAIVARLESGSMLAPSEIAWVHTVDLDSGAETSAEAFLQQIDSPEGRTALSAFLVSVAAWIDESLQRETVLTIYGY